MANPISNAIHDIIASSQRPGRKAGKLYVFKIPRRQPKRRRRRSRMRTEVKIGRSIYPPRRRTQWMRQCRGQEQEWLFYWDVPDATKFEALIHLHYKLKGAWIRPTPCEFCGVRHVEKFDYERCGGKTGIIRVVQYYLRRLNWPITRHPM
ncbi:hypothetical protein C8R44DRAFT_893796 [Mycena epipterygia]|nr:hypothetical protein C8R44DRAFT_893796 [Mycena epipterygia]